MINLLAIGMAVAAFSISIFVIIAALIKKPKLNFIEQMKLSKLRAKVIKDRVKKRKDILDNDKTN